MLAICLLLLLPALSAAQSARESFWCAAGTRCTFLNLDAQRGKSSRGKRRTVRTSLVTSRTNSRPPTSASPGGNASDHARATGWRWLTHYGRTTFWVSARMPIPRTCCPASALPWRAPFAAAATGWRSSMPARRERSSTRLNSTPAMARVGRAAQASLGACGPGVARLHTGGLDSSRPSLTLAASYPLRAEAARAFA